MPSTASPLLRLNLQAPGEGLNIWGGIVNNGGLALLEQSIAGWANVVVPAAGYTLQSANFVTDEARMALIRCTGAGGPLTIPNVSKSYTIWNACAGVVTVTNGSASATVQPGEVVDVITDGVTRVTRVQPTDFGGAGLTSVLSISGLATPTAASQATSKSYVDTLVSNTSFAMAAGQLPMQTGNAGKILTTNGSVAGWDGGQFGAQDASNQRLRLLATGGVLLGGIWSNASGQVGLSNSANAVRLTSNTDGTVTTTSDAGVSAQLATVNAALCFAAVL